MNIKIIVSDTEPMEMIDNITKENLNEKVEVIRQLLWEELDRQQQED